MPRATADMAKTVRMELNSCPGGFVVLRKLNNGEMLHRRDIASNVQASGENEKDMKASIGVNMSGVAMFEFTRSIVEHNLEDEAGRLLDFNSKRDFDSLDNTIADEIDGYITKMNKGMDMDPSQGPSMTPSSQDGPSDQTTPALSTSTP